MNILYSTGCPRCNVLIKKLQGAGIEFIENNDKEEMKALGIDALPVLNVDGEMMGFLDAIEWIKTKENDK